MNTPRLPFPGTLIAAVAVLGMSPFAHGGAIRYVDDDALPGGDGVAWNSAYRFLQDALSEAASDATIDEIRVARGTYRPHQDDANPDGPMTSDCCEIHGDPGCDDGVCEALICALIPSCCDTSWDAACAALVPIVCDSSICIAPDLRLISFKLVNGVALRGGYAGQGSPDPDARDIDLHETILTGDLLGDDGPDFASNNENSYHVVTGSDADGTPELDGFTITAGNANGTEDESDGGGLYMPCGGVTVRDCRLVWNFAGNNGGGAHSRVGAVTFVRCVFEANAADDGGGLNSGHDTTLTDCTLLDNYADRNGGGAVLVGTIATLTGCRFEGNDARIDQGGLRSVSDTLVMTGTDFIGNTAVGVPGSETGAARLSALSLTVRDCTFVDNHANDTAGAIQIGGEGVIEDCLFEGNSSGEDGGAIVYQNPSEALPILGCTFIGNESVGGYAGAIYCGSTSPPGHLVVRDSTFAGNMSNFRGGAIYTYRKSATVVDCLFDSNEAGAVGGACAFEAPEPEDDTIDVHRCMFIGNTTGQSGGGLDVGLVRATVSDCSFVLNSAQTSGGGLSIGLLETTISGCVFSGNTALDHGGGAAAYANDPGGLVDDCVFVDNTASRGGGLYAFANIGDDPVITVTGCRFLGNQSEFNETYGPGSGGGVYLDGIDTVLVNSTFSGNTAEDSGGGLFVRGGHNPFYQGDDVHIVNCTLSENTALVSAGGALDENFEDGTSFSNCILWGNVDSTGLTRAAQIESSLSDHQPLVNYSCVQNWDGAYDGVGNIDDDPLLADPDGVDGDTGTDDDDLRLLPDSPCIDAGDNTAVPEDITTDLDGNPRFLEIPETPDTGNGTLPIVDMGAYESLGGGCLAVMSQEIVCHANGTAFTVNIEGLNACTGGTTQVTFTASGGAVGEELCFTALVNDGGFCCTTEICVTIPDCAPAALPSDLDGDGIVGMMDFLALLEAWGSCSDCGNCLADFDGDCSVGILDLLTLLGNWG